ncbi:hypothetical protein H9L39_17012 [Fusarium oxysporum f. sp. albedinis]|nr:hypothetical protein H9L39_17012 [Fusarium oxysporum f. sp. albedinis]
MGLRAKEVAFNAAISEPLMAWRWLNDKVRSEVLHVTRNGKGAGGIHAYFACGRAEVGGKSGRVRVMFAGSHSPLRRWPTAR